VNNTRIIGTILALMLVSMLVVPLASAAVANVDSASTLTIDLGDTVFLGFIVVSVVAFAVGVTTKGLDWLAALAVIVGLAVIFFFPQIVSFSGTIIEAGINQIFGSGNSSKIENAGQTYVIAGAIFIAASFVNIFISKPGKVTIVK